MKEAWLFFAVIRGQTDSIRLPVCCFDYKYSLCLASSLLLLPHLPLAQDLLFLLWCSLQEGKVPVLCACSLLGTVSPTVQWLPAPAVIPLADYHCCHCWSKRRCSLGVWTGMQCPVIKRDMMRAKNEVWHCGFDILIWPKNQNVMGLEQGFWMTQQGHQCTKAFFQRKTTYSLSVKRPLQSALCENSQWERRQHVKEMSFDHNRMCTPPPGWHSLLMLSIHIPAGVFTLQHLW